jgi:hypothetical protein
VSYLAAPPRPWVSCPHLRGHVLVLLSQIGLADDRENRELGDVLSRFSGATGSASATSLWSGPVGRCVVLELRPAEHWQSQWHTEIRQAFVRKSDGRTGGRCHFGHAHEDVGMAPRALLHQLSHMNQECFGINTLTVLHTGETTLRSVGRSSERSAGAVSPTSPWRSRASRRTICAWTAAVGDEAGGSDGVCRFDRGGFTPVGMAPGRLSSGYTWRNMGHDNLAKRTHRGPAGR